MLTMRPVVSMFSVAVIVLGAGVVSGQSFPYKPIRIITSPPGGGSDFATRQIAQGLPDSLGQPVIVENRPGVIGVEIAAKAQPDGYTLFVDSVSFWITPLIQKMPYEPLRDFSPVSLLVTAPNILVVHPSVPAKSVNELIALAKAKPGALNYGTVGTGSSQHLGGELFKSLAGVNIVNVPFKAIGIAVPALIGGEIQLMFASAASVAPFMKSDKLRALAVTSAQPSPLVPGLPTVASTVPGYVHIAGVALFAPGRPPEAIINRLSQETARVLNRTDVKERFAVAGSEIAGSSPGELVALIKSDVAKWSKVIKEAGIKAD